MDVTKIAAAGMQRDMQRMDGISQNVANLLTPGYKKQMIVGTPFFVQFAGGLNVTAADLAAQARSVIDPGQGTLRYTGNAQDVAVEGDGFLEIATPDGLRYTRQGALRVDVAGRLVGVQGWPVMGTSGEIGLTGSPFSIDAAGQVTQDGRIAGRLKLVRFTGAGQLQPVGQGLYAQGAALVAEDGLSAGSVRTGFQENSNVNSPQEMVSLTDTVRHFEALSKIVQGYDDVLEKTIRKLGEF